MIIYYYADVIMAIEANETDLVDVEEVKIVPLMGVTVSFHKNERLINADGSYDYRDINDYIESLRRTLSYPYKMNLTSPLPNLADYTVPKALFIYEAI